MESPSSRELERSQLSDQLTVLKSLLRLDADGICGTSTDLSIALASTRSAIDAFSSALQKTSDNLDPESVGQLSNLTISPTPPSPSRAHAPHYTPSIVSSSRSSWRCESSASTSATSISPRESLRHHNHSPVSPSPSPCLNEDHDSLVHADDDNDDTDESFARLSSILASLQAQAEAAVSSPSAGEEEVRDFWAVHDSDESSPISTRTIRTALSIPSTPGLRTPRNGNFALQGRLTLPITPRQGNFSFSNGLVRRCSERIKMEGDVSEDAGELERLVGEFLDHRLGLGSGEEDVMFRWVWMWLMGGGVVYLAIAWVLGWGCGCVADGADLCLR